MLDPELLRRAASLLGACQAPTVTLEPRAKGGREYVAQVTLEDGEHEGRDYTPGLALHALGLSRGVWLG